MPSERLQKIKSVYKSIDQYGVRPQLGIKGENTHQSVCGTSLTIFIFLAGLAILYISARDFIAKQNPDISSSIKINKDTEERQIGPGQQFNMAVGMFDNKFQPIQNSHLYILGITLKANWKESNISQQITLLDTEPCTKENAPSESVIGKGHCLANSERNKNVFVAGEDDKIFFMEFKKCYNNPPLITHCADKATVDQITKDLRFMIFYNDLSQIIMKVYSFYLLQNCLNLEYYLIF